MPYIIHSWKHLLTPQFTHPAANLFPINDTEVDTLAASIKATGSVINPVVLLDGKVLDGRNRLRACDIASIEPIFMDYDSPLDPILWVTVTNGPRRDLTQSQKAVVALAVIDAKYGSGEIPGDKRVEIANIIGVGRHYVSDAVTVSKKDPSLLGQIKSGSLSLPSALRLIQWKETGGVEQPKEMTISKILYMLMKRVSYTAMRDAYISSRHEDSNPEQLDLLWERVEKDIYGQYPN